jgi:hypothetical protein
MEAHWNSIGWERPVIQLKLGHTGGGTGFGSGLIDVLNALQHRHPARKPSKSLQSQRATFTGTRRLTTRGGTACQYGARHSADAHWKLILRDTLRAAL